MNCRYKYFVIVLLAGLLLESCTKSAEVDPPKTQIVSVDVFKDESLLNSALLNIYSSLIFESNFGPYNSLYVDELSSPSTGNTIPDYLHDVLKPDNSFSYSVWKSLYSIIYQSNALLEGIPSPAPDSMQSAIRGECKFLRAYSYLYLVNIYGEVPLLTTTNVATNASASRSDINDIYLQIIADLTDAENTLPVNYPDGEKVRANKWAAAALLSRVYLYTKDWKDAETQADNVINSGVYSLTDLSQVFVQNNSEAIFQLWLINGFTAEGANYIPFSASTVPTYTIAPSLLNAFENGDNRKSNWIQLDSVGGFDYYYPYKYKNRTTTIGDNAEYLNILRFAEQYLNRAEAKAQQGQDLAGAIADINTIRTRAGLSGLDPNISRAQLLDSIYHERRIELFCENGHRFFDLKRWGLLDATLTPIKPSWNANDSIYPIPQNEIIVNPHLTQNAGY